MIADDTEVKKLLVIDLGQVGDVIMSFPALAAIRKRFPESEMVVMAGKTPAGLIRDLGLADRVISIDRHALLEGPTFRSLRDIGRIVGKVRRDRFDLVIDLHSLHETNLLGYLSGAGRRLFANRRNRSLDFLSNFRPRPPVYEEDKHLADIYLDVLEPLGVTVADRDIVVTPPNHLIDEFRAAHSIDLGADVPIIGLAIGAGHPSRKWALNKYVELARRLSEEYTVLVFLGPEEKAAEASIRHAFDDVATVIPDLSLIELAAAFSTLAVLVGNDTGTTHLASVCGTSVVMIADKDAPATFAPLGKNTEVVKTSSVENILMEDVLKQVTRLLEKRADEKEKPKKE